MKRVDTHSVARRLVASSMYMTIATADPGGRPWVSPVWFAPRSQSEFLWVSSPDARHSRNIAARPEIAIVIFDSTVAVGSAEALYLEAVGEQLAGDELDEAIAIYSAHSQKCGARPWVAADVRAPARFRLYRAVVAARFVLGPGDERLPVAVA
jgi:uncharacterized protein YhbP (UPF0306 family)